MQCWAFYHLRAHKVSLFAVFNDQIRPPIKTQKEEKLAILNTYAFTIDLVPHVFGEYCFATQTQMHEKIHQKALSDADLRKGTIKTSINSTHSDEKNHQGAA